MNIENKKKGHRLKYSLQKHKMGHTFFKLTKMRTRPIHFYIMDGEKKIFIKILAMERMTFGFVYWLGLVGWLGLFLSWSLSWCTSDVWVFPS